jgi:hypothetical protein
MTPKKDWTTVPHQERMHLLATRPIPDLAKEFRVPNATEDEFRDDLQRQVHLWDPSNIESFDTIEEVPTKDLVLGAWRDLDRAEAIMELIDNSVDAWQARKRDYPQKSSKKLFVSIDIDAENGQLIYEDNAGGVSTKKLANLVVPGFSDTDDFSPTIGSYKTGGKKAVFRLASAARIISRFWDPDERRDETIAVQLDQQWIENTKEYTFPFARLKDHTGIDKGSTRYILQLRNEDLEPEPWYATPGQLGKVQKDITNAYTLLLIRQPAITIMFRKKPIVPNEQLYSFSGKADRKADIRPQQIVFRCSLEFKGQCHSLELELVLGCRTTTGVKDGKTGGIDLYGNDRLFVSHDQNVFADLLPTGNSRNLVRGFVNIRGPNVFIPWDTHKRHLNEDREIVRHLTKSKLIILVFENWKKAYRGISRLGSGEVTAFIKNPVKPVIDTRKKDLNIPHRAAIPLELGKNRGVSLPKDVFVPKVPVEKRDREGHRVTLTLTTDEARSVMAYYGRQGEPTADAMRDLAEVIKEELMEWVAGTKHE